MKKTLLTSCIVLLALARQPLAAQTTISVFNGVLYYDGYATTVTTPAPPAGIIRHRNDLYARQLTAAELQAIGTQLSMKVTIAAACLYRRRHGHPHVSSSQVAAGWASLTGQATKVKPPHRFARRWGGFACWVFCWRRPHHTPAGGWPYR